MTRRQLHALCRYQAGKGVVLWFWHIVMHVLEHLLVAVWAGDFQHLRVHFTDLVDFRAEAAGNNDLAVFIQRFADSFERFLHCAIDKAAGVDDNHIGIIVARHHIITFGTQFGEDAFGVYQVLRATQRDKADFRLLHNIAHSLKSVQLLEWSGQGFYRDWRRNCTEVCSPVLTVRRRFITPDRDDPTTEKLFINVIIYHYHPVLSLI
ncbi:hypothetical protein HMPREF0880_02733 [Yokenella regensburgei ATCC 43003]|nr:hypothetical protein HMPREF0880_02733 [Yokenella regensburgei ATCC 43003]